MRKRDEAWTYEVKEQEKSEDEERGRSVDV